MIDFTSIQEAESAFCIGHGQEEDIGNMHIFKENSIHDDKIFVKCGICSSIYPC